MILGARARRAASRGPAGALALLALLLGLPLAAGPAAATPPRVVEAGKAPAPLRYAFEVGATTAFRATLDKTVTERLTPPPGRDGVSTPTTDVVVLPTMQFRVAVRVAATSAEGTELHFVASQPHFVPGKGVDPGAASALAVAFKDIPEIAWTVSLDATGGVLKTDMRADPYPASTLEVLQLLIESLKWAWVALPAEPVGQGGRFEQHQTVAEGGFSMAVTTQVTRSAEGLAVEVKRASTAPVPMPKPPEGDRKSVV